MKYDIQIQRIYAPAKQSDGARVLVDRLWPRGRKHDELILSDWYKDASPSTALRRAWHNDDIDDEEFIEQYRCELEENPANLIPLMRYARSGRLTLLTASHDPLHSHLPILCDELLAALRSDDLDADGVEPSSPVCYQQAQRSDKTTRE
jgi:uncharacterized protein YeaO (DUF488 family)